MSWDKPCDLCRVYTPIDALERVADVFPLGWLCAPCAAEVREDADHPRDAEPECACRSHCAVCTPGA